MEARKQKSFPAEPEKTNFPDLQSEVAILSLAD